MLRYTLLFIALCVVFVFWVLPVETEAPENTAIKPLISATEVLEQSGYDGIVLIYDLNKDVFWASQPDRIEEQFIPASTFKIFSSLVALETGILPDKETVMQWDGVERSRPEINKDLKLAEAFQVSAVPHYQELVRRIGASRMQAFVDSAAYGNRDLSGGIDQFWLTGALRISPKEQIMMLRSLHADELPFSPEAMDTVKEIMITETGEGYVIRAKTGWGIPDGTVNTGWWVGWIETNDNTHFFATVIQSNNPGQDFGAARRTITKEVLQRMGVL